jgi:hypothetical protein
VPTADGELPEAAAVCRKGRRETSADIGRRPVRRLRTLGLGVIGSFLAASPLLAHHEWPVDLTKQIKLRGTVTAFTWANPHVMIALDVEANGTTERWKVGGSSPQFMTTCGWNKKSLKPGDVITVVGYRFKDGSHAARMLTAVMPNGKEMFYGAPPGHTANCVPRAGRSTVVNPRSLGDV